ncbi:MAG: phosphoglycerate kinase, partial [Deltaproteobacteria bacterium]|nr:phosphoglycerate kinase [Deltaproteobacteria bacterium]
DEEEKNDSRFSEKLASLADVYINDAFGTLHRSHSSTVGMVSHFKDKGVGHLVKREVDYINQLLEKPERPFIAILGGAKVADKLGVVEFLLNKVDALLIGGAMAYTFLKASGVSVGKSLVEDHRVHLAAKFIERAKTKGIPLLLPIDHVVATDPESKSAQVVQGDIPENFMGLDIGPKTIERFEHEIKHAKTIIWNGPLGLYETPPYNAGTLAIAKAMANCKGLTVVGGGDSAAAVKEAGVFDEISHVSTGGGATLACLEGKTLPGLKALNVGVGK